MTGARAGRLVLAFDQGSSATKAALIDERGRTHARAAAPVARRVEGERVEHDPEEVLAGVERLRAELEGAGPARPVGLALACQRSSCLLWERAGGRALTPVLSWQDRRETARTERLAGRAAEIAERTGLRLEPQYAGPKLAGLLEGDPALRARAERGEVVAGTLDAFLCRRLAGLDATEPGCAGRTLLYDLEADAWSPELCALWGVPERALPELRPSLAARGGAGGSPLLAVAGDQQAALVGHGGWAEGMVAAHFGTGAFVLAATGARIVRADGLLSAVLASRSGERRYQLESTVQAAGSALDLVARWTGIGVASLAGRELEPERLPWVVPSFAGLGAPWWRARTEGAIGGLRLDTSPADLMAATAVGVAQRVLDGVEAMRAAGVAVRTLRASGRLTRLAGLVGLLADAGQLVVEVLEEEEAGLAGVAALAFALLDGGSPRVEPEVAARREPAWPPARAERVRARWRETVALVAAGPGPPDVPGG